MFDDDDDDLRWECLGAMSDWPDGTRRRLRFGAREIGVIRQGERFFAFKDRCPHRNLPMVEDAAIDGNHLRCPHHGWAFCIEDGSGPEGSCLRTYPTRRHNNQLWIGL